LEISDGDDDVYELFGNLFVTSDGIFAGHSTFGGESVSGLRFQNVAIPQGSTIDSATLTINISGLDGSPDLNVYGNDVDNAAVWSDPGNMPSDITKTTALKNATPGSTGSLAIDVTNIVQEIIDRGGWTSGNSLALCIFDNAGSGNNEIEFDSFETSGGSPATLDITYS
jgi:hypothetical protein